MMSRRFRVIGLIFTLRFLNVAASAGPYTSRLPLLSDEDTQQAPSGGEASVGKDALRIPLARNPAGTDASSRFFMAAASDGKEGYTVTFDLDGKGTRVGGGELVQTVPHGGSAVAPEVEADPGWEFVGWSTPFNDITAPLTVVARYSADIYTVTFDLAGKGTRIGGGKLEQTVFFGYPAIAPIVQANTGWVFEGWDLPFDVVTGPLTVTALYVVATYPVTFDLDAKGSRVGGGELLQTVIHGEAARAPEIEANPGWTFEGWDVSFDNITSPLTVVAQYRRLTYTVTFELDGKGTRIGGGELTQTIAY
ncbi:MAG TPA: InlB B-repeat-containing protein, partial [Candidatus Hydrogenedentes bacterium]|nr:InlB B-repeat-containing protein [Candidatus Hydrogenedentota bacterium]